MNKFFNFFEKVKNIDYGGYVPEDIYYLKQRNNRQKRKISDLNDDLDEKDIILNKIMQLLINHSTVIDKVKIAKAIFDVEKYDEIDISILKNKAKITIKDELK